MALIRHSSLLPSESLFRSYHLLPLDDLSSFILFYACCESFEINHHREFEHSCKYKYVSVILKDGCVYVVLVFMQARSRDNYYTIGIDEA
jgi:hypothetical protein